MTGQRYKKASEFKKCSVTNIQNYLPDREENETNAEHCATVFNHIYDILYDSILK